MASPPSTQPVILLAFANDRYGGNAVWLRDLAHERRAIEDALAQPRRSGLCEVVVDSNATHKSFFDKLTEHGDRIVGVHFGGHADPGGLKFEDAMGRPADALVEGIAISLQRLGKLRWVFLNGCGTAPHVRALHEANVGSVIATERSVRDDVAADFARRFYDALAWGQTLDDAFALAVSEAQSKARVPESVVRMLRPLGGYFSGLRAQGEGDDWPWILRHGNGSLDAGMWRLVLAPDAPNAAGTPIEMAIRRHIAQQATTLPPEVRALLEEERLGNKRARLYAEPPSRGLALSDRWLLTDRLGDGGFAEV